MKNSGAVFLILGSIAALYLYNTGRAEAIVNVLKDPDWKKPNERQIIAGNGAAANGGGGGGKTKVDPAELAKCYAEISAGGFSGDCIGDIFGLLRDPFDSLKQIGNIFTAPFGIKL